MAQSLWLLLLLYRAAPLQFSESESLNFPETEKGGDEKA